MNCEDCFENKATLYCLQCEERLCTHCESTLHRRGTRKAHFRQPLCSCGATASSTCTPCAANVCLECHYQHSGHILEPVRSALRSVLYWDSCALSLERRSEVSAELEESFDTIFHMKVYRKEELNIEEEVKVVRGMKEVYGLVLDLAVDVARGLTCAVVLSQEIAVVQNYVAEIQTLFPHFKCWVSRTVQPLQLETFESSGNALGTNRGPGGGACGLVGSLKELAAEGKILNELGWLGTLLGISVDLANSDHVCVSTRSFPGGLHYSFVSLKLEKLDLEVLIWVLRSLKQDRMAPSERAIQSRAKEVFGLKPSRVEWDLLFGACRRGRFLLRPFADALSNTPSFVVYPEGEEWESLDIELDCAVKESPDWNALCTFLNNFFCVKGKYIDESRAIAGGRYGCAQFLQLCGGAELQACPLGKLSAMVQLAINESLLRYSKTLLIWTPAHTRKEISEKILQKLETVKEGVRTILKANRLGVPLAQLPLLLKRKLGFAASVSEFGFSKLKELLLTMPEVALSAKEPNQSFATLRALSEEETRRNLKQLLSENKWGLPISAAESLLTERTGVSWPTGLLDFIAKCAPKDFDIISNGLSKMIIRSDLRHNSFCCPHKQPHSSVNASTTHSHCSSTEYRHSDEENHTGFIEQLLREEEELLI